MQCYKDYHYNDYEIHHTSSQSCLLSNVCLYGLSSMCRMLKLFFKSTCLWHIIVFKMKILILSDIQSIYYDCRPKCLVLLVSTQKCTTGISVSILSPGSYLHINVFQIFINSMMENHCIIMSLPLCQNIT